MRRDSQNYASIIMNLFITKNSKANGGAEKYFKYFASDYLSNNQTEKFECKIIDSQQINILNARRICLKVNQSKGNIIYNVSILGQLDIKLFLLLLNSRNVIVFPHLVEKTITMKPKLRWLKEFNSWVTIRLAKHIISISEGNKATLVERFGNSTKKIKMVKNYVKINQMQQNIDSRIKLYKKNFAIIGRLQEIHKGQLSFIDECHKEIQQRELNIFIYGDGPDKEELKHKIKRYGISKRVQLMGYMSTEQIYKSQNFSSVISLSRWEGLPLSLLEAHSMGKIVVGRNIRGNSELLIKRLSFNDYQELFEIIDYIQVDIELVAKESKEFANYILSEYNCSNAMSNMQNILKDLQNG